MIAVEFDQTTRQVLRQFTIDGPYSGLIVGSITRGECYVSNDMQVIPVPEQPSPSHTWNWTTKQWAYDLSEDRAQAWSRIKSARESVEFGPFAWGGQTFDGDSESQRRIQGAAQLATLAQATGQPFSIDWTLADNTQATLTAAEMIGVGVALGQHVNGAHGIARTLRTQIDAATTPEELEAIQWPV